MDIDYAGRAHDVDFHQVEQRSATGEKSRTAGLRMGRNRLIGIGRAEIIEVAHQTALPVLRADWMAATIFL